MSQVARKLLIVKRDPPESGYNVMAEINGKTRSFQVTDLVGERILDKCYDAIIYECVQRGSEIVTPVAKPRRNHKK